MGNKFEDEEESVSAPASFGLRRLEVVSSHDRVNRAGRLISRASSKSPGE